MTSFRLLAVTLGVGAGMVLSTARGAIQSTIQPVSATASSTIIGFDRLANYTRDGSGLTGSQHGNSPNGTMWLNGGGGAANITFNLGSLQTLDSFRVWNYNEGVPNLTNRGARNVLVSTSNDDVTYSTPQPYVFPQASGLGTYTGASFGIPSTTAQYVRFSIADNYGGDYMGLSEVRFQNTTPTYTSDYVRPTVATASTEFAGRQAVNTLNGSGLDGAGQHGTAFGTMWLTSNTATGTITYDLGAPTYLTGARVWNYNENSGANPIYTERGMENVNISVSNDGVNFSLPIAAVFSQATGTASYAGTTYSTPVPVLARYVRFDGLDTFGNTQGNYLGLSEVRFTTSSRITGVTASASTEFTSDGRLAANLVNNAGMSGSLNERAGNTPQNAMWLTNGTAFVGQSVTFDLNGLYNLQSTRIWNYNEAAAGLMTRGIQSFDIATSTDGVNFSGLGTFALNMANGQSDYLGDGLIDLGGGLARFVRFTVNSNYGDAQYAGLSEVRFYSAVPEPGSMFLVLAGCASLLRFRRRTAR